MNNWQQEGWKEAPVPVWNMLNYVALQEGRNGMAVFSEGLREFEVIGEEKNYASGTNHVLPTYGYTATCSSLGLADFQKRMTVQELSKEGFSALASTIETLAAAERLTAHKNAVTLRVNALKEQA